MIPIRDFLDKIMRENMGDIVNLRRVRKERAVAATKESAGKRAESGRGRAERDTAERARVEINRFEVPLREAD
jgi:hypothetical protein